MHEMMQASVPTCHAPQPIVNIGNICRLTVVSACQLSDMRDFKAGFEWEAFLQPAHGCTHLSLTRMQQRCCKPAKGGVTARGTAAARM
jgi:hypothetical protein